MMTTVDDTGRSCSIIHSRLTGCALSVGCCCCLTQCRGVKKTKPQNQPAAQPRGALLSIAACRYGSYYNYFLFMLKRRIRWKQEQSKGGGGPAVTAVWLSCSGWPFRTFSEIFGGEKNQNSCRTSLSKLYDRIVWRRVVHAV